MMTVRVPILQSWFAYCVNIGVFALTCIFVSACVLVFSEMYVCACNVLVCE